MKSLVRDQLCYKFGAHLAHKMSEQLSRQIHSQSISRFRDQVNDQIIAIQAQLDNLPDNSMNNSAIS